MFWTFCSPEELSQINMRQSAAGSGIRLVLLAWSLGLIVAAFAVVDFFISKPDQFNGILLVRSVSRP